MVGAKVVPPGVSVTSIAGTCAAQPGQYITIDRYGRPRLGPHGEQDALTVGDTDGWWCVRAISSEHPSTVDGSPFRRLVLTRSVAVSIGSPGGEVVVRFRVGTDAHGERPSGSAPPAEHPPAESPPVDVAWWSTSFSGSTTAPEAAEPPGAPSRAPTSGPPLPALPDARSPLRSDDPPPSPHGPPAPLNDPLPPPQDPLPPLNDPLPPLPSDRPLPLPTPDQAHDTSDGPAARRSALLAVIGLSVSTGGRTRLDGVDLTVAPGTFVAVLGTSGAGKSTLLKAITGMEPATAGTVSFEGRDLYENFDNVRHRIGYVPQDDILHSQLTVRETLDFAAQLRFPAETSSTDRARRIDAVLDQLGLTARADGRIDQLSGGQRKRVNVAVELLTEPPLLILDEPTSGLDPGNERSLMELLRRLADAGRGVIVVTHSVESLHLCDEVLFLATGGLPVFLGPAADLPGALGADSVTEVFSVVEHAPPGTLSRIPSLDTGRPTDALDATMSSEAERVPPPWKRIDPVETGRQVHILCQRYLRVLTSDRRNLLILGLQAPVMAIMMLAVFGESSFVDDGTMRSEAGNALMAMVLGMIYLGASNAVREIVKERNILRREQNFGLSTLGYVTSKLVVLGAVTIAQAGLLVIAGTLRQGGLGSSVTPAPAHVELFVVVAICGMSALALGLAISAAVSSADKAMTLLPVALFAQFLLAGLVFPLENAAINIASALTSARWGFAGAASTADYWMLRSCNIDASSCSSLWQHSLASWSTSTLMLVVLGVASVWVAWWSVVRGDPSRQLARLRTDRNVPAS